MASLEKTAEDSAQQLETLPKRFNRIVKNARTAIFIERLLPRTVPPLCVSGLFLTSSWAGLWHALPPQGRMAGVLAFGAAAAISPFLTKTKSLRVTTSEALDRIDDALGDPMRPARMINDDVHENAVLEKKKIMAADRLHMLETWIDRLDPVKPRPDMKKHDPYYGRYLVAASIAVSAALAGQQHIPLLKEAFNWTIPPVPVIARAWITPPEEFKDETFVLTQDTTANQSEKMVAHQGSTMTVLIYNNNAPMTLNGAPLTMTKENKPKGGTLDKPTYQYEFKLTPGMATIKIGDDLHWTIQVRKDEAPSALLESVGSNKKQPNVLDIQYREKDDYGVKESTLVILPPAANDPSATPLPSSALPKIDLR